MVPSACARFRLAFNILLTYEEEQNTMPTTLPLIEPIQLSESLFNMDGISEDTMTEHQAMYERLVKRYNDIVNVLGQVNR